MRRIVLWSIGLILLAGNAAAQTVSPPTPAPGSAVPPPVSLYTIQRQTPQVAAFEQKRALLRSNDYAGMTELAVTSLTCPIAPPMGDPQRLDPTVVTGARALLRTAAEHGDAKAQSVLAKSFLEGRCGASADLIEGYAWLKTAGATKAEFADQNALDYYRRRLSAEQVARAEYQAYYYTQNYSKPFSVAALVVPEMACPDARDQVGVYLSGEDFSPAEGAVRPYVGAGYPSISKEIVTPDGCVISRNLNRFMVRMTEKATVSEINAFLEDKKFCIAAMAPLPSLQNSGGAAGKPNLVLVSAEPPEFVEVNEELLQLLRDSQLFQTVKPSQSAPVRKSGSGPCTQTGPQ